MPLNFCVKLIRCNVPSNYLSTFQASGTCCQHNIIHTIRESVKSYENQRSWQVRTHTILSLAIVPLIFLFLILSLHKSEDNKSYYSTLDDIRWHFLLFNPLWFHTQIGNLLWCHQESNNMIYCPQTYVSSIWERGQ